MDVLRFIGRFGVKLFLVLSSLAAVAVAGIAFFAIYTICGDATPLNAGCHTTGWLVAGWTVGLGVLAMILGLVYVMVRMFVRWWTRHKIIGSIVGIFVGLALMGALILLGIGIAAGLGLAT